MYKGKSMLVLIAIITVLIAIPVSFAGDSVTDTYQSCDQANLADGPDEGTIYVSKQGNDDNPGSDSEPVETIAKSIELASKINATSPKIIVGEGTYEEYNLEISSPVEITANGSVVIDGGKKDSIFYIDAEGDVKITGITFQNSWGSAVNIVNAKVTIDRTIFINNTSDKAGAIYWNADEGTLTNSYFTNNRARNGAAVVWGGNEESELDNFGKDGLIVNVTIDNNDNANTAAGCMGLAVFSNNVRVLNSTFINNRGKTSSTNGALYLYGENILVDRCLFENNTMAQAPAIQANGNNATITNCMFKNNTIANNTGMDTSRGGAIEIQSRNAQIVNNTFIGNGGDECYNGGAIAVIYSDPLRFGTINITNNHFCNNSATYGGCIFMDGGYESYCEFEGFIDGNVFDSSEAFTAAGVYLYMIDPQNSNLSCKNNVFSNLFATCVSALEIDYAIAAISNNTLINCTSLDRNNDIYNNEGYISGNLTVTVNNNDTLTLLAGHYMDVNATVVDDMGNGISGGIIRFIVAGADVDEDGFSLETGTATVRFYSTVVGIYPISADYTNGDLANVKTSIVIALPYEIIIQFDNQTGLCEETIQVPINVGVNGEYLESGNITVIFNDTELEAQVIDGTGIVELKLPETNGTYNLTVIYDIKGETRTVTVKDNHVTLTAPDVKVTPNTGRFNLELRDSEDNPLSNETVYVTIDGVESKLVTDANGTAGLDLNLTKGNYTAQITYIGDLYKSFNSTSNIIVDYLPVILSGQDITANYGESITYVVRLADTSNAPIANETLTLIIGSKTTNHTTDSNGVVSLLISESPGIYDLFAEYAGNNVYASSNATNRIVINSNANLKAEDITMYYSDSKKYIAYLYDANGEALAGETVNITINNITYAKTTNAKGVAKLKITENPGTYTVTAAYNYVKINSTVVVKNVIKTKNVTKKKAKTVKFKAKLAMGKTPLKNKKVKFKINGKKYTVKTNKKGAATLSLKNLKVGSHKIYTCYGTSKVKNTIKIKK